MTTAENKITVRFEARGAVADMMRCRDTTVLLDGPAGTGKTSGILQKAHLVLSKYKNARGLMVRKTRASLTNTAIKTFEKFVLTPEEGVRFHTPTQSYRYPRTGSELVVGGLDDVTKVMSSDYDIILLHEATEATKDDYEALTTRLRNGRVPYQQMIMDCNPTFPNHWLNRMAEDGKITRFWSKHEDNPSLWDSATKTWTKHGKGYMAILNALQGVRYKRLRLGLWVTAEGTVYENFDPDTHVITPFEIPGHWRTVWAFDFGYTHPFCFGEWHIDDQGRLYLTTEIYKTKTLVEDHCEVIKRLDLKKPSVVICDHDAEDRATLERHLGVKTIPAIKDVTAGIQIVTSRLNKRSDGKPGVMFFKDALYAKDKELASAMKPVCTVDEFDSYVWDESLRGIKETPKKEFDHGQDQLRYTCMHFDAPSKKNKRPSILLCN